MVCFIWVFGWYFWGTVLCEFKVVIMDHFWVDVFILVWEFGGPSTTSGWLNKVIWLCSRVCCLTIKHTPPPLLPPLIMVPLCTPSMCVGSVGPAPTSRGLTSSRSPSSPLPAREGPSSLLQRSSSSAVGQRASLLVLHGARVPQKKFLGSPSISPLIFL